MVKEGKSTPHGLEIEIKKGERVISGWKSKLVKALKFSKKSNVLALALCIALNSYL